MLDYTYDMQGQNNPTYQIRGLKSYNTKESGAPNHFPREKGLLGWSRSYIGTQPGIEGKVLRLDEFQSDWAQDPKIRESLGDFPIDHNDFKKLMIVDGLDRTLKEGLDTMVIPITRTLNNLVGTKEVSQAYRDLNIGILPKIRQELEKSGLLLDIKHVKRDTGIKNEVEEAFVLKLKDKAGRDFGAKLPKGYTAEGIPTQEKFIELKKALEDKAKLGYKLG